MLRIGAHTIIEEGELLMLRLVGDVSLEEMQQVIAAIDSVIERCGYFAVIGDVRELRAVSPEARKFAGRWENVQRSYGTAIFGASFGIRTLIGLLSRAITLFRGEGKTSALEFFKTEEEARSWLQSRRGLFSSAGSSAR